LSRVRVRNAQGATFVELFFDLVFVFAITQITSVVVHDLTRSGLGKAALLFWLVWWAWTQFTWTLNLADTEHVFVRVPTLVATAVAFFMAQSVPDAFTDAGAWFAVSYVVVRLIGIAVQAWVIAEDQQASISSWASWSMLGILLVAVGGFADPEIRIWLWIAAFAADVLAAGLAGRKNWVLEPGHFAERHGLIVIIALGESLIAAGVASADIDRDATWALTAAGAVAVTCALWWNYFGTLHSRLEQLLAGQPASEVGRFARDVFSFWHAMVVAGVIAVAVAFEEAIAHPHDPLSTGSSLALTVGVALFVGGLAAAAWRSEARGSVASRTAVAVIALGLTPLVSSVAAGAALGVVALLVTAANLLDWRSSSRREVVEIG
jgi:low temperature requirement protein LtrA